MVTLVLRGQCNHDCPVCFEYLFESVNDITVMPCGHTIHKNFFKEMQEHYQSAISLCGPEVSMLQSLQHPLNKRRIEGSNIKSRSGFYVAGRASGWGEPGVYRKQSCYLSGGSGMDSVDPTGFVVVVVDLDLWSVCVASLRLNALIICSVLAQSVVGMSDVCSLLVKMLQVRWPYEDTSDAVAGDTEPIKMFDRTTNLANNQITNYRCDPSGKWLGLIGIALGFDRYCPWFSGGIPCSLSSPLFSPEKMLEKRQLLRNFVRKEMGLTDNDVLVMSLSSINPGKGQFLLLESRRLLIEGAPPLNGSDVKRQDCHKRALLHNWKQFGEWKKESSTLSNNPNTSVAATPAFQ
ncbi:hypothetical protein T459_07120 [Capsicum annuum]|uniref:RING-type domain-containing protein n=1 Tax=Capsicum annuum TaxID=4072 RepID=A0A2G3ACQ7_CAPAN|nr:hypothetical protein T459_07120 [Capsicum annuum]